MHEAWTTWKRWHREGITPVEVVVLIVLTTVVVVCELLVEATMTILWLLFRKRVR